MHDGAAATFSTASYFFDDDGVLAQDTEIIRNGVLVAGISDLVSATELGTAPTGNGRRESYKRKAYSRMTNTFFCPGSAYKTGYCIFYFRVIKNHTVCLITDKTALKIIVAESIQ